MLSYVWAHIRRSWEKTEKERSTQNPFSMVMRSEVLESWSLAFLSRRDLINLFKLRLCRSLGRTSSLILNWKHWEAMCKFMQTKSKSALALVWTPLFSTSSRMEESKILLLSHGRKGCGLTAPGTAQALSTKQCLSCHPKKEGAHLNIWQSLTTAAQDPFLAPLLLCAWIATMVDFEWLAGWVMRCPDTRANIILVFLWGDFGWDKY